VLKVFDVRSRRVAVALVTLVAGGALAACGSASSSSGTTSSASASASASGSGSGTGTSTTGGGPNSARRAQLVSCLKAHGVTLPARPAGSGPPPGAAGGGSGTGTTGTGTSTTPRRGFFFGGGGARNISPKMQAAFKACGAQFGFGRGGGAFRGRISHTAINSFVACVKQHGYSLPAPDFSGKGPIFPRSIETNAKFQAAAKSCQHLLIPARPSGGASGGTSTTSGA
jgi:hypothetical protein